MVLEKSLNLILTNGQEPCMTVWGVHCTVEQSYLMTKVLRCQVYEWRRMRKRERKCSLYDLRWRTCHWWSNARQRWVACFCCVVAVDACQVLVCS